MKWFVLLCVLAGCFSDEEGLHIIVRDKTGHAISVDMYIALHEADGITGMTPENSRVSLAGSVLILDSDRPATNYRVHDGEVVFNILPKAPGTKLDVPLVVFIGRNEQGGAVSFGSMDTLSLEAGGSVAYAYDLQEVASSVQLPSDDVTLTGTRIYEWSYDTDAKLKCIDVEFAEDAANGIVRRYYLVPPDDPDCDGATECTPADEYIYGPPTAPTPLPAATLDNVECASQTVDNGDPVCALGAKTIDVCDPQAMRVCAAFTDEKYCAPLSVCSVSDCFDTPDSCFSEASSTPTVGTYVDCSMPADDLGAQCTGAALSSVTVSWNDVLAPLGFGTLDCRLTQVWHPGQPAADHTLVQNGTGANVAFSTATTFGNECSFSLGYEGGALSRMFSTGSIDLQIGDHRHLVLPLRVTFVGCTAHGGCQLVKDDADKPSLRECVEP